MILPAKDCEPISDAFLKRRGSGEVDGRGAVSSATHGAGGGGDETVDVRQDKHRHMTQKTSGGARDEAGARNKTVSGAGDRTRTRGVKTTTPPRTGTKTTGDLQQYYQNVAGPAMQNTDTQKYAEKFVHDAEYRTAAAAYMDGLLPPEKTRLIDNTDRLLEEYKEKDEKEGGEGADVGGWRVAFAPGDGSWLTPGVSAVNYVMRRV